ncbi:6-phosphogluconate dehydrogenase [Rhypophila decipiens]|uniref:3-hydroxyisobutyrate dehydrogenase n=1 Tax=Rhypophila decipiens TaxID=261697 RepID=A0AAN6YD97_9PEZI|nr:6-phosphogluconate dehydrogenase [Rhypophila decipiens]
MPSSPNDTVAFIGLGVMGYPMAKNLRAGLATNKTLLICDINTEALDRFKTETERSGPVEIIANGFEAAKVANTVITMLPTSSSVKEVYLDPETGILAGAAASSPSSSSPEHPKLLLECGTIDPPTIQLVHKTLESMRSIHPPLSNTFFVDAPVSGGPMGAQSASLTFMVGCSPPNPDSSLTSIFSQIKSYLSTMGPPSSIFPCGPCGSGTAFKIINNYLSAITSLAASEALNMGVKAGLDPKLLTEVINASGGQCWVTSKSNPVPGVQENVPSSRDYEGGFRIELCAKVLGMGSDLARAVGARTVLDGPTLAAFAEAMADGRYKGKDARVVYRWLSESGSAAGNGEGEE